MINLFCIPFAGGSRYSFNSFLNVAPKELNIISLELPGRGSRIRKPLLTSIDEMVDDLFHQMKDDLDAPYAIYGHSLGSLLTILLARKIRRSTLNDPLKLFVSGRAGPSVKYKKYRHNLPSDELFEDIKEMGGIPVELFEDQNLLSFFEPIIRADFKAIETYEYAPDPLEGMEVHVYIGSSEGVSDEEARAWQEETSGKVVIEKFAGDHFFIFGNETPMLNAIGSALQEFYPTGKSIDNQPILLH